MTSRHHQKPIDYCDAFLNLKLRLSLATCIDVVDYANWTRNNATQLCLGFDRYMRDNEGDIHPREQVIELAGIRAHAVHEIDWTRRMSNTKTPPLHQSQLAEDRPDAYRYARRVQPGCMHMLGCRCETPYWLRSPTPTELARWYKVLESEQST